MLVVRIHGAPISIVSDRDTIFITILEGYASFVGYKTKYEYHIPSTDRWAD